MNQKTQNAAYIDKVNSSIGVIEYINTPKIKTSLKHPYQYKLYINDVNNLLKDLKKLDFVKNNGVQHYLIDKKSISKGIRLQTWILADYETTKIEWDKIISAFSNAIRKYVKDAVIYVEDKVSDNRKPQARWETYIQYAEIP